MVAFECLTEDKVDKINQNRCLLLLLFYLKLERSYVVARYVVLEARKES